MKLCTRTVIRRVGRLAVIAVIAAGGVTTTVPASADPKQTTRDPDLPPVPTKIADLFIADSYTRPKGDAAVVSWFCPAPAEFADNKICDSSSKAAFGQLTHQLDKAPQGRPSLLRVGKARDDCENGLLAPSCGTGVPTPPTACLTPDQSPFCAFTELKNRGMKLGVVVGSREKGDNTGRPIEDIAWQACQIHVADTNTYKEKNGFYDFLFLDQAHFLRKDLQRAVKYINGGKVLKKGGKVSNDSDWIDGEGCKQGWDVITNDNGVAANDLAPQAWGHAKRYDVATQLKSLRSAAEGRTPALTDRDIRFINDVNRLKPPNGFTTGAILRVEVTEDTDHLARLTRLQQCSILTRWAEAQSKPAAKFASLFPLYNHGLDFAKDKNDKNGKDKKDTKPYNSFAQGTASRQLELIKDPKTAGPPDNCG